MAITRTPIIDDDGTGTTGTVIDNAWKTELYNQIDGAVGGVSLTLLYSSSGSSTLVSGGNLTGITVPGLAQSDTIELYIDCWIAGPVPGPITVTLLGTGSTSATLCTLTGTTGGGDLTSYAIGNYRGTIRCAPGDPNQFQTTMYGLVTVGETQARGVTWGKVAVIQTWGTAWSLYLQQVTGLPAGTPLSWKLQAYIRRGGVTLLEREE